MTTVKTFYFLERDDPSNYWAQGDVIALTPDACSSLSLRGIKHQTLEDFYSEKELRSFGEGYFNEQLRWFREFDAFLKNKIPFLKEHDLNLASAHHSRIIYLIDSFIIRSFILNSFLDSARPSKIICLASDLWQSNPVSSLNVFYNRTRCSFLPLLSAFQQRGFDFDIGFMNATQQAKPQGDVRNTLIFNGMKLFKKMRRLFYPRAEKRQGPKDPFWNSSCFFCDTGSWSMEPIFRDLRDQGCRIFVGDTLKIPAGQDLSCDWEQIYAGLEASGLLSWHNKFSPLKLESFLAPYMQDFIRTICPKVINDVRYFLRFFKEQNVEMIISRASVGPKYTAPLLAAKASGLPRICFQHSTGPLDMKSWLVDELLSFDCNFAISTCSKQYFEENAGLFPETNCRVFEYSGYLLNLKAQSLKKCHYVKKKPTLLYCPFKLPFAISHFNVLFYPMTWYFKFQLMLLRHLAAQNEYKVIYKPATPDGYMLSALNPWLRRGEMQNIKVEIKPLVNCFSQADRILFDYPSTGLFEAAVSNIPALCLFYETGNVWPPMKSLWGPVLQKFSDEAEALMHLDKFLSSSAADYLIHIPLCDISPLEYLKTFLLQWKGRGN